MPPFTPSGRPRGDDPRRPDGPGRSAGWTATTRRGVAVGAAALLVASVGISVAAARGDQGDEASAGAATSAPAEPDATTKDAPDVTDRPSSTPQAAPAETAVPEAPSAATEGEGAAVDQTSGQAMPVGDLDGWTQVFADDFDNTVPNGSFPGPYRGSWETYDGFSDTSRLGTYREDGVSTADGKLALDVANQEGSVTSAAVVPLVGGEWGGQVNGRFSVRMRADSGPGFYAAFLLWSDDNDWDQGEINFPEGDLTGTARAYNHTLGDPSLNSFAADTGLSFQDWHTYTIEWRPDRIDYLIDDQVWKTTYDDIPVSKLHWVMQIETTGDMPPVGSAGRVEVDWATVYSYDG